MPAYLPSNRNAFSRISRIAERPFLRALAPACVLVLPRFASGLADMPRINPVVLASIMTLTLSGAAASSKADDADVWKRWQALLQQSCPNNHVDWACDVGWTQLTGAFEDTLGASGQRKLSRVRDFGGCEKEMIGLSCE